MKIKCNKCNKIVEVPDNWDRNATCSTCGGYFSEIQSNYPSILNQFNELGNQFRDSIPHIIIGKTQPKQNYPQPQPQFTPQQINNRWPNYPYMSEQDRKIAKIKEWALYICISLVVGFAVYTIFF